MSKMDNENDNHNTDNNPTNRDVQTEEDNDDISITSKEIMTYKLDVSPNGVDPVYNNCSPRFSREGPSALPESPVVFTQPLRIFSNVPSPMSLNMPTSSQPQSLFLQALAKLNTSSISLAFKNIDDKLRFNNDSALNKELSPPDSLTSAPPSYSFVLRQMAARRRPRLMGTFYPSPSFVQHTPPPNYATAFDIYVDNPITQPPPRIYNFGFTPMPIVCPQCGHTGMTVVTCKITLCTHLCAMSLCLMCCWICAPLPYVLRSCKDVYHYCRNCRSYLGMYCPTSPDSAYT
ncbi:uncharacterized protein LOC116778485 [Danaus plexippus]|uniref:uncharacterized protein LOC116778485 n=1 Tax=Danaus plexippus TaxID=13037 RepID=UPI002AB0AC94|nr:uncharacterized protein LOC116778485 [Danaus plexippus]